MSVEYYNLLQDTLRSSYLQVKKIYQSYLSIYSDEVYVNIRTGFCMKYRPKNPDYIYSQSTRFPLCINLEGIGDKFPDYVIEKLLKTYDDWLEDYHVYRDNDRIKDLVDEEMEKAKEEAENANNWNINKLREDSYSNDEEGDYNNDLEDSFVVEDKNVRRVFKKRLGKRPKKVKKKRGGISEEELNSLGIKLEDDDSANYNKVEDESGNMLKKKRLSRSGKKVKPDLDDFDKDEEFYY